MVAFWRELAQRPFGADGLAGSARPLPSPAHAFPAGRRTYTWHRELALPAGQEAAAAAAPRAEGAARGSCAGGGATGPPAPDPPAAVGLRPAPVAVEALQEVWCPVEDGAAAAGPPSYADCFQF